jgi:hypothetical protein
LKNLKVLGTEKCPKRFFQEPHRRWGSSRNLLSWRFLQEPNCPTETFGFEFERTAGAGT